MARKGQIYYLYAFLSALIVGLGQMVKGNGEKGLKFLLLFYFPLPVLIYISLLISGAVFLVVFGIGTIFAVIFWLYNVIDAFKEPA